MYTLNLDIVTCQLYFSQKKRKNIDLIEPTESKSIFT